MATDAVMRMLIIARWRRLSRQEAHTLFHFATISLRDDITDSFMTSLHATRAGRFDAARGYAAMR